MNVSAYAVVRLVYGFFMHKNYGAQGEKWISKCNDITN